MGNRSMFAGMDVHKETIDISVAEGGRQGEVRHYGVIAPDLDALDKVVRACRRRAASCTLSTRPARVGSGFIDTSRLVASMADEYSQEPGRPGPPTTASTRRS